MEPVEISMKVNGKPYKLKVYPNRTLLSVLRDDLKLTGAKEGCGIGECGACTVLLNGKPVYACLVPIGKADGGEVETVEGLSHNGELHPLQEAFIEAGAVQCGYCTPGMIMSALHLLRSKKDITPQDAKEAISGNLCRCTGYVQIVDAIVLASRKWR